MDEGANFKEPGALQSWRMCPLRVSPAPASPRPCNVHRSRQVTPCYQVWITWKDANVNRPPWTS